MSGCFNHVLPYLVDNSGAVRLTCRNVAMPVWDLAIWLAPDWPRNRGMRPPVVLFPPKDDFYAIGLWHRSNRRYGDAATAFLRELKTRSSAARYGPGDIEHQLSEMVYDASDPQTWSTALEYAQKSLVVRNADDAIGLSASRISEARIRMVQILNQERYRVLADDLTARIQILPEDLLQLDGVEKLLREVKAIRGGSSAENKSQVAMISGRIALARGDLTSAVASFHEGGELMIEMQESSLWHHYHVFSLELLHHGWIARSHEFAVNAFQFAMHSGDFLLPTRLREFCERLEAAYPDLKNE